MEWILQIILEIVSYLGLIGLSFGLAIEGLGLPFPGETVLVIFGYLAKQGEFGLISTIIAASLGAWIGSLISFYLGRNHGVNILYRYHKWMFLKEKHIDKTVDLSARYGALVLVLGRHLPGVRTVSSYVAGIGRMKWSSFLVYSLLGFTFWTATWLVFGYIMANRWQQVFNLFQSYLLIIMLLIVGSVVLYKQLKSKKKESKG